jgi:Protein of unknown function (DUF3800)
MVVKMTLSANYDLRQWFRSLTSGLSPQRRAPHALMMLTGYFDDSGSERKGPVFVLAGYLSVMEVWEQYFTPKWEKTLAKSPSLDYFKMREANRLHDAFRGWTETQRDERVAELSDILVHQPVITSMVFAMSWDDFKRAEAEYPEAKGVIHPYDMLFHGIMASATARMVQFNLGHQIEFVFDEQGSAGERAILTYKRIKSTIPKAQADLIVGSPRLADDKIVLPLQAADLLAWHVRRYWVANGSFPIDFDADGTAHVRTLTDNPAFDRLIHNDSLWKYYDYRVINEVFQTGMKPISDASGG